VNIAVHFISTTWYQEAIWLSDCFSFWCELQYCTKRWH